MRLRLICVVGNWVVGNSAGETLGSYFLGRERASNFLVLVLMAAAACNDNELGIESRAPNRAPETKLSGGPRDSTASVSYRVHLHWSGTDPDGTIDHYDFILVDHSAAVDNIDGRNPNTQLVVRIPDIDDSRWLGTRANDSLFVTLADTLRGDRPRADEDRRFERWHTFFIRAVDDVGAPDPTPDYLSFNSVNIAPTVSLMEPVRAGQVFTGPPVCIFNWEGEDKIDAVNTTNPIASRWVMLAGGRDGFGRFIGFPDVLYTTAAWTTWRRWGALDGSGKRAIVRDLRRLGETDSSGVYYFAVQAMDEAGAVTPVFDDRTPGRNNAVRVLVSGRVGALLRLEEEGLGTFQWTTTSRAVRLDIATGQPLRFRWEADASDYGGEIDAFRYGWDLLNPNDDAAWDASWSAAVRAAPERSFVSGSHTFYLQARDNAETITRATLHLTVHPVSRSRDLLWVDDSQPAVLGSPQETQEDSRWLGILEQLSIDHGFLFDRRNGVYDVADHGHAAPPLSLVFDHKATVWSVRGGGRVPAALQGLARFADPFVSRNQNLVLGFNYLATYLHNRGNLWINGYRVANTLWPPERHHLPQEPFEAVNVTNWDDPIEPHPYVFGVGTRSLLYATGIEAFDCGAGADCPRSGGRQFCNGLARAGSPGAAMRQFETAAPAAEVAPHVHRFEVPATEVEAVPAQARTYSTSSSAEVAAHEHMLTLSARDFDALRSGAPLNLETAVTTIPVPHTHAALLVDTFGLWGAPALQVGTAWDQAAGRGRANVEIYNMPAFMASRRPLLPGRSHVVTLYTYVSSTPQDVNAIPPMVYPLTADGQPVCVLAKGAVSDVFFSRCFMGFEPEYLTQPSHRALAEFILMHHFRLGRGAAH